MEKRALTFMPMYKHLSSHIAHFMRYNRRKWKPLIDLSRLAQCHRLLSFYMVLYAIYIISMILQNICIYCSLQTKLREDRCMEWRIL